MVPPACHGRGEECGRVYLALAVTIALALGCPGRFQLSLVLALALLLCTCRLALARKMSLHAKTAALQDQQQAHTMGRCSCKSIW